MTELSGLVDRILVVAISRLKANPQLVEDLRSLFAKEDHTTDARPYETVAGYATRVGVSKRTVETLINKGMPIARSGRIRRIPVKEADAWLQAGGADAAIERRARLDARRRVQRLHASADVTGDGV